MTARLQSRDGCVRVRRAGVTRLVHTCHGYLPRYVQPYSGQSTMASLSSFFVATFRPEKSISVEESNRSCPLIAIHLLASHVGRRYYQECILLLVLGRASSCLEWARQKKFRMDGQIKLPSLSHWDHLSKERTTYSRLFLCLISRTCQGLSTAIWPRTAWKRSSCASRASRLTSEFQTVSHFPPAAQRGPRNVAPGEIPES